MTAIYISITLYILGVYLTHKTVDIATVFLPETHGRDILPVAVWVLALFWPLFSLSMLLSKKKPR